ncbi:MAG TPA: dihydroneopterin aldolase [Anaerolineaceae bacterium]
MQDHPPDQVIITDLLARGVIGISERERSRPQDILINLILFTDTQRAASSDDISDCIDYSQVARKVLDFVENAQRFTVEALASDLASLCLAETSAIGVRVRVEKPGAIRFARSVGVEIERFRSHPNR